LIWIDPIINLFGLTNSYHFSLSIYHVFQNKEHISFMMRGWDDRLRYNEANEIFCNQDIAISKFAVERTIKRFEENGSVKNIMQYQID